PKMII
ncbi:hypothetical protein CAPN006_11430, partial [Capnocytophaga canimorsus]